MASNQDKKKEASNKTGATSSGVSSTKMINAWWRHHKSSCQQSLLRLLSDPVQSLMTWMAIAIAITLPISLFLALQNIQQLGQSWQDNAQMSVFLNKSAKPAAVEQLLGQLKGDQDIESVELVSADKALQEFRQHSGLGAILDSLDNNPLPSIIVVQPASGIDTPEKLDELSKTLKDKAVVDDVQLDMGWLQRLYELLSLGQRIAMALGVVLIAGVLLIIGNTLRLAIENRRNEIVVVKMVGGTDGFVRRPFLYTGFWYGIGGGILAILLLGILNFWLANPIANLSVLYNSQYQLVGLDSSLILSVTLMSGILGWFGAWVAVARHLHAIQPT